jgi:Ran GTPase-activating protein (RanGAP) involved in mRNA processing and transport
MCEQKLVQDKPRRYDVRSLVLLGCSHEASDGSSLNAEAALKLANWKVLSIHGTGDQEASLLSAQVFHAQHRAIGHRLRLVTGADHSFSGFVGAVSKLTNDVFEGARRLNQDDIGASAADGGACTLLVSFSGHADLSGTRPGSRMLGSTGVVWLAEELKSDLGVTSLDLSCNNIRASGATALAAALEVNTTLKSLDLRSNALLGARAIGAALQRNKSLTRLDLQTNGLGANGAAALAAALEADRTHLTALNVRDNAMLAWGAAAIAGALRTNTLLVELDLAENLIKESGAAAVAEALALNSTLTALSLRYNGVRAGALPLGRALARNEGLQRLDLRDNDMSTEEASFLRRATSARRAMLLELDLVHL